MTNSDIESAVTVDARWIERPGPLTNPIEPVGRADDGTPVSVPSDSLRSLTDERVWLEASGGALLAPGVTTDRHEIHGESA
ncbi:hypothetical protein [Natrinema caseinilyticum]|uniref:hypothetical protein n=1 Tax=Natrinema caseinilyticum TaxID=2961570 RepID=UPI0020C3594B|nr:hypothetical protein [Natrinema caseinilyticum]